MRSQKHGVYSNIRGKNSHAGVEIRHVGQMSSIDRFISWRKGAVNLFLESSVGLGVLQEIPYQRCQDSGSGVRACHDGKNRVRCECRVRRADGVKAFFIVLVIHRHDEIRKTR